MLDLQKYLNKASADPGFRARLLKNPNQAIKDEFGEDLPYQLKCQEKLVFEIEPMEEMSDADAIGVAGGNPRGGPLVQSIKAFNPQTINGTMCFPNGSNYGTYITFDENGNRITTNIMRLGNRIVEIPKKSRLGEIPKDDLDGVTGGSAVYPTPSYCLINDVGPKSASAYRQGYGFDYPPVLKPDSPCYVRGGHSPFVRFKDDSEIRKADFDGIGTVPYVSNLRDAMRYRI